MTRALWPGRAAGLDADCLSTKDSGHGGSEAEDRDSESAFELSVQQLVGEELETLLEPQAGEVASLGLVGASSSGISSDNTLIPFSEDKTGWPGASQGTSHVLGWL